MIPELGHFSLILAMLVAFTQMHPVLYRNAAILQFILSFFAFFALMSSYILSDFTVINVAENSHTLKPLIYKISGTWGNHEGSMLLWVLMLSLFGFIKALTSPHEKTLRVLGAISAGFIAYTVFASNPFLRISPAPFDGMGLNPILQDPALAIHPPLLYMGYVGFSVAFASAVGALWEGRVDKNWASDIKPWIIFSWTSLTAGIALGSYWAYYELGWGGWWFWDPVENASLMPWLLGTALLHSVIVLEKRQALKRWTILLCILSFSLAMLGTFLVRSGVLTSVHAFATDPKRGIFILALLAIYSGSALFLFAIRASKLKSDTAFSPVSKEGALVFNNLFLATLCMTVFIGTLYPLILSALDLGQISVGPPYFHATFIPISIPLILLMAIGPFIPWKKGALPSLTNKLKVLAIFSVGAMALIAIINQKPLLFSMLGIGLAVWAMTGSVLDFKLRFKRLAPLSQWAMNTAHLGIGVAIIGMSASTLWLKESTNILSPGDNMNVGAYELSLIDISPHFGPNYNAIKAQIKVSHKAKKPYHLYPERRHYPIADKKTTETAIKLGLMSDLYITLGDKDENGWLISAKSHPFIHFIWAGFIMVFLSGLLALSGNIKWQKK